MKAKHIIPIIGVLGAITTLFALKGSNSQAVKSSTPVTPEPEKLFAGVPLSKLTELAKKVCHGLYCTIDQWDCRHIIPNHGIHFKPKLQY